MNPWDDPALSGAVDPDGPYEAPRPAPAASPDELGRGAFSAVLRGVDRHLPRDVAWKVAAASDRAGVARLAHEARVLAALEHPSIVPIYDLDRDPDGSCRIALRIVRGKDLGRLVAETPSMSDRLRYVRHLLQAVEAVAWAHRQGFVHRDLKPTNIMIGEFGETQVIDWGLALVLGDDAPSDVGLVVGTPQTMSPEQARGEQVDARSDVWSLGATLWHLVAGRAPWAGRTAHEIIEALAAGERPSLAREAPGAPRELAAICERAMAPEVEGRYPDALALAADLAAYVEGRQVGAHRYSVGERVRRFVARRRIPLAVAALAAVVVTVVAAVDHGRVLDERRAKEVAEARAIAEAEERRTTAARANLETAQRELALEHRAEALDAAAAALVLGESPEARAVVGALSRGSRIGERSRRPIADGLGCVDLQVAPSGRALCGTRSGFRVIEPDGRVVVSRDEVTRGVAFADDGATVVGQRGDFAILRWDASDGRSLGPPVTGACTGRLQVAASARFAVIAWPNCVAFVDRARVAVVSPCPGGYLQTATARADGRFAALCRSGELALGEVARPDGLTRVALRLGELTQQVSALALVGPDHLLVGSLLGQVARVDLADGAVVARRLLGGRPLVRAIAVAPDAERAVLALDVGAHDLVDVVSLASLGRFPRAAPMVGGWVGDGAIVTAGAAVGVVTWDVPPGAPDVIEDLGGITGVAVDGRGTLGVTHDFAALLLDDRTGRRYAEHAWAPNALGDNISKGLALSDDGGASVAVLMPSAFPEALLSSPLAPVGEVRHLARLGDDRLVVDQSNVLSVIAPRDPLGRDGPDAVRVERDKALVVDLAARGRWFASIDDGPTRTIGVWSAEPIPVPQWRCPAPTAGALALRPTADGPAVVTAERDGLALWRPGGCELEDFLPWDEGEIVRVAVSPTGRWIAAGTRVGKVLVWDGEGKLAALLLGHAQQVTGLEFAPDERWLLSAAWDGRARFLGLDALTVDRRAVRERLIDAPGAASPTPL